MTSLEQRLSEATGPDRELDLALAEALVLDEPVPMVKARVGFEPAPAWQFTASIDAALSLVGRKLPGAWWIMAKGRVREGEPLFAAQLFAEDHNPFTSLPLAEAEHDDLCIAVLLALVRALQDKP